MTSTLVGMSVPAAVTIMGNIFGSLAAAISTVDSMGSALSAIFTRDIYARLLVRDRDDRHYVLVGRLATIGVLLLGFLYLPFIWLQKNMLDAFTTLIPVFVTPLLTMYVLGVLTRVSRASGMIGLSVGAAYGLFALYCREAPKIQSLPDADWAPLWLTDRWGALICSLLITSATMALATLLTGKDDAELKEVVQQGWLQRSRETLPPLLEHPFLGPVPWWASPAIYAALLMLACLYVVFVLFW